jgi:DNA polymerase III alpha subunit
MYRTGYSFRTAIGHIDEVISRLSEIGATCAPISDRCSTFGFTRWTKACKKENLRPVYGVELAVVPEFGAAKPIVDYCRFIAIDSIAPLNELIGIATANPDKEPSLLYKEAIEAPGLIKIFGERD